MATIQDVAQLAGVSVATVSRVLNRSSAVTESTREAVLEAIKTLNYQPNLLGRNLRKMETRMVLVLLPNISNPFYARIVKGMEDIAHNNGYNVMLCNTDSNAHRERVYIDLTRNKLADGIILMAPEIDVQELDELGKNIPVVQCCEYKKEVQVSHVSIDDEAAAYDGMRYLIGLGHRRIGMISAKKSYLSRVQRENGYQRALKEAGLPIDASLIKHGDYRYISGINAMEELLRLKDKPTAIFAISDIMALGALRAIKQHGMNVPQDVAVMGFDNISSSSMSDPMLTTVSQPKYELGCKAMELLLRHMRGELKDSQHIVLQHEIIVRESTTRYI